ncbi:MAG: VanZ family protein, partial [Gemmatimonadaceae bacterium]
SLLFVAVATLLPGAHESVAVGRANFWCLACDPLAGTDAIANTLLFVPLGAALLLVLGRSRALLTGILISVGIETLQHFGIPSGRDSNLTDVLTNSLGTFVGIQLAWNWRILASPSPRAARILSASSAVCTLAVLAFVAWALGRDVSSRPTEMLEQSTLPYTPGFGWYHGYVLNARVRKFSFDHPGDGPLILSGELAAIDTFTVRVARRDVRNALVPLLYLHKRSDTLPQLIIGQSGADARVRVAVRAARLRLVAPELILPRAFSDSGKEIRTLQVVLRPARWSMQSERAGLSMTAELPLTIGLGWVLVQGVVRQGGTGSSIVSLLWMCALFIPVGYWSLQTGNRRILFVGGVALIVSIALWAVPEYAGISPTLFREWIQAAGGFVVGIGCAMLIQRRRSAP